jgi:hypothetical protein
MVSLTALWLPIVLSAVAVFIASSIFHMVLPLHRKDYGKLPNEDKLLEAMRNEGVSPGNYAFPCPADPKDMHSPEMIEKYKRGPVGMVNVLPTGSPAMGKYLVQWFIFCLVIGVFAAYLTGRTTAPGADYLAVFRVAGTTAFLGYAVSDAVNSIWRGQWWSTTFRHMFDGLVYALLTGGIFGWLWP